MTNFPFGRLYGLDSIFNERAGPRQSLSSFLGDRLRMSSPFATITSPGQLNPHYVQASHLYPERNRSQPDDTYRYKPNTATVIPVVHLPSTSSTSSSPLFPLSSSSTLAGRSSIASSTQDSSFAEPRSPTASSISSASNRTDTEAEVDALTSILMQSMESKGAVGSGDAQGSLKRTSKDIKPTVATFSLAANKPMTTGPTSSTTTTSTTITTTDCYRCRRRIDLQAGSTGDVISITGALSTQLHPTCFTCYRCATPLHPDSYYHSLRRLLCPQCAQVGLERCTSCDKPVTERVIRALGVPYHPQCFNCAVCAQCLDGRPFTVDVHSRVHCLEDFHRRYAPRCASCGRPITPQKGAQETKRIVAGDKNYHLECFGLSTEIKVEQTVT